MSFKPCPSLETLHNCAIGNLSEAEADDVFEHLDACTNCEEAFTTIRVPQPIGQFCEENDFRKERECSDLVKQLTGESLVSPDARKREELSGQHIRDYQLIRQLGRGGMGTVYLARHTRLNKLVAIKLVPEHSHEDPTAVARFEREMQAVGLLDHPNVVGALDAGDAEGMYFLTMELVDGCNLSRFTRAKQLLQIADACEIVRQVADGMQYAHKQGLIHRDIKPSNLMLARDQDGAPSVKILDLGLATMPEAGDNITSLTDENFLVGTLEYMAPEQCDDSEGLDHRADIYSLGVTLYRLLTGTVPFHGPEFRKPARRLFALTSQDAPGIVTRRDDLPELLTDLVDRMLSRDPAARPQSMTEVADVLSQFSTDANLAELLTDVPEAAGDDEQTLQSDSLFLSPSMADTSPTAIRTVVEWKAAQPVANSESSGGSGSNRFRWLAFAAAIPMAILAAVIWIKTDEGYIRIEHDEEIEPTLEFFRDGEPVEGFQVTQGKREISFRTGQYEVRFASDTDDNIQIKNNRFYLKRNGRQIVRIERVTEARKSLTNADTAAAATNTPGWRWDKPVHLGGEVNSEWKDDQPTLSADGLSMIFGSYCIPRFAGEGDRDLWMTTRVDLNSPWKPVSNLGAVINSPMKETHPSFHSETGFLAFASNRRGGVGAVDLWYSTRDPQSNMWTRPVNMGPNANSKSTDDNPEISSDGLTLYFASKREGGAGGNDLWLCRRDSISDRWKLAERLPEPINSAYQDSEPALSRDQRTLVLTSDRPGGAGGRDLWAATRSDVTALWGAPFNLGPAINTPDDEAHATFLPDGKSLVFASTREGGLGGTDLWTARRIDDATAPSSPSTVNDGLVAMWLFDELKSGNVRDSSGNALHGKLHNTVADTAWGSGSPILGSGQALRLLAASHVVTVPHDSRLDFSDQISVSMWFRGTRLPESKSERIISKASKTDGYSLSILGAGSNNPGQMIFNTMKLDAEGSGARSGTRVFDGEWHHIAGTFDGTELKIYIDGQLEDSRKPGHRIGANTKPLRIGSDASTNLAADVDDVCIYDRALLASEVVALTRASPEAKSTATEE